MATKTDLQNGDSIVVTSHSSGHQYTIRRDGIVYYCDCPAWKFQNVPIEQRTCKHIKELRGAVAEMERLERGVIPSTIPLPASIPVNASARPVPTPRPAPAITVQVENHMAETNPTPGVTKASFLLAQSWDGEQDPTGYWLSEKLDGVRAYWKASERNFYSREGNVFHVPEWFKEGLPSWDLDGELFGGRGKFQETVGIVKRNDGGELWKKIHYVIFDAPEIKEGFEVRVKVTKKWFSINDAPYAVVLNQMFCKGMDHLRSVLDDVTSKGGEGVMLREPGSRYCHGRSSTLLKVKKIHDAEALVTGYKPGTGKHEGRMGAIVVSMPNGISFKIGTGFSDEQRDNPPPIGSVVSYGYQGLTNNGIPLFSRFLKVRSDVTWNEIKGTTGADATKSLPARATVSKRDPTGDPWVNELIEGQVNRDPDAKTSEERSDLVDRMRRTVIMQREPIESIPVQPVAASTAPPRPTSSPGSPQFLSRYEYKNPAENSFKFWEIRVNGNFQEIKWGRIGTAGQSQPKTFPSYGDAIRDSEKRLLKKEREGYRRVW